MGTIHTIIIDDEPIIRSGLQKMITWEKYNIQIDGTFSDGESALNYCESHSVDLAITDIKMPLMDGITFMKQCHAHGLYLKFVVLSSYTDFVYVKEAAQIGIENYLLKPIDIEEMRQTLFQVARNIQDEREKESLYLEGEMILKDNLIFRIITGSISDDEIWNKESYIKIPLENTAYRVAVIKFMNDHIINWSVTIGKAVVYINNFQNAYAVVDPVAKMIYCLFWQDVSEKICLDKLRQVQTYIETVLKLDSCASLGEETDYVGDISTSFRQAYRKAGTEDRIGNISIYDSHQDLKNTCDIPYIEKGQLELLRDKELYENKQKLTKVIKEICYINRFLSGENYQILIYAIASKIFYNALAYRPTFNCSGETIEKRLKMAYTINNQDELTKWLLLMVDTVFYDSKFDNENNMPLIRQILYYIDEHYMEALNLNLLGTIFHINSVYLGKLIKNEVGMSFNCYINLKKIEKAKNLLLTTNLSAKEIAVMIGYNNDKYFNTMFKKLSNITPMEFRRQTEKSF